MVYSRDVGLTQLHPSQDTATSATVVDVQECQTHLQVSKTWQRVGTGPQFQNDHAAVVAADEMALQQAQRAALIHMGRKEDAAADDDDDTTLGEEKESGGCNSKPVPTTCPLPGEIITAPQFNSLSQREADRSMEDMVEEENGTLRNDSKGFMLDGKHQGTNETEQGEPILSMSGGVPTADDDCCTEQPVTNDARQPLQADCAELHIAADDHIDGNEPKEGDIANDEENSNSSEKVKSREQDELANVDTSIESEKMQVDSEQEIQEHQEATTAAAAAATRETSKASDDGQVPAGPTTPGASSTRCFAKGTIVHVQARTWPGINKPGGVGRIAKVHDHGIAVMYDVAYILGGREKQVDAAFVTTNERHDDTQNSSGKRRRTDTDEIPLSVLQALAADGFDTGNQAEAVVRKKVVHATKKEVAANTKTAERKPFGEKKVNDGNKRKPSDEKKPKPEAIKKSKSASVKGSKSVNRALEKAASAPPTKKQKTKSATSHIAVKVTLATPQIIPLPSLTDKEKCDLADEHYNEHFESAKLGATIHIVSSTLSEDDCVKLELLCKESKGMGVIVKHSDTFNPKKTHLCITPLDNGRSNNTAISRTRTMKAMRAALAGIPIVSPGWLDQCLESKCIVGPLPEMYIRSFPSKTSTLDSSLCDFGVAIQAARMRHQDLGLISKHYNILPLGCCFVHLCGAFASPKKADICMLLKEAGATVMASPSLTFKQLKSANSKVILLCDNATSDGACGINAVLAKQVREANASVSVVNPSWLFDSISCGVPAPGDPYEPCSPLGKALWALCK